MNIYVVSSCGTGQTHLSAFDNALIEAGVANYNVIPLSSVIPRNGKVLKVKKYKPGKDEIGCRLYVVMAHIKSSNPDSYLGAGLGWYYLKSGGGLFVEHELEGYTEQKVKDKLEELITASLSDLCKHRDEKFETKNINMCLTISPPKNKPRCALCIAVYKVDPWIFFF